MTTDDKRKLYLQAIKAYFIGVPIMSDHEFDTLEKDLKKVDPDTVKKVGARIQGSKKHPTPMLSLDKVKVLDEADIPWADVLKWLKKFPDHQNISMESSPKLDGNAINLVYINNVLDMGLTRTDAETGNDVKNKLALIVPHQITGFDNTRIEVRCEVVLPTKTFFDKYKPLGFANERNLVAGFLGSDDLRVNEIKDLKAIVVEIRIQDGNSFKYPLDSVKLAEELGFETYPRFTTLLKDQSDFELMYYHWKTYRKTSKNRLDGFVIKLPEIMRMDYGMNDHDPEWGLAIKFPPVPAVTKIIGIENRVGKSGNITPVALLDPVDLDGSTVSKATCHNYGIMAQKKIYPGAKVKLVKSGDIIPRIVEVLEEATVVIDPPAECPVCKAVTTFDGTHCNCSNPLCPAKASAHIEEGCKVLGIDHVGSSTADKLVEAGLTSILDMFTLDLDVLNKTGLFGRDIEKISESVDAITELSLTNVILSLRLPDVGRKVSAQVAREMSGLKANYLGLNKSAIKKMITNTTPEYAMLVNTMIAITNKNVKIIRSVDKNEITFEMTGVPPRFYEKIELRGKREWADEFAKYDACHTSLGKNTNYLVTDDKHSTTGKMAKALKYGVRIVTYPEFMDILLKK